MLAEVLGADTLRDRVKIYATDVDEEALERARHGLYSEKEVASVPEETKRIRFIEGTSARTFSARSDSRGLGAPKLVPCAAASATARTISGCA